MTVKPDALFADPRLAPLYDRFDNDRSDLDVYEALIDELGAFSVLDIGCGTGSLAVRLAARGLDVVGVDPAEASLDVAEAKPHASDVRWILGDAEAARRELGRTVDLAIMTGNVAQVFVSDESWNATLEAASHIVRSDGFLVFETRDPARQAWRWWTPERSRRRTRIEGEATVESWCRVTDVDDLEGDPLVSFQWTYRFDGPADERATEDLVSDSTLRFRDRPAIEASLRAHGFETVEVRDAPDRPALEFVFIARRG
ncbi:MAG: class I SAM-dependent methyltransferase [Actinomycetota bacterium]